jgi:hypothetical protein
MATDFATATRDYYAWLARYLPLDPEGLREKRARMDKKKVFPFLRGTFYRWSWQSAGVAEAVRNAPSLLSAGDVHLENFGTWRDAEGRLVWGLNDLDEAAELPFTCDLLRLATSILVARQDEAERLPLGAGEAVGAVLDGYLDGLEHGQPFVLDEAAHAGLRAAAMRGDDPATAWAKIRPAEPPAAPPDAEALQQLLTALPQGARPEGVWRVQAGLGALGRPRWRVVAQWQGGALAREAKATAPSAALMPAVPASRIAGIRRLAAEARRATDPGFGLTERWVVRRLSPEARKIEMKDVLPRPGEGAVPAGSPEALLRAMGGEIANLHAGTARDLAAVQAHAKALAAADPHWLHHAAEAAAGQVAADHATFRRAPEVVQHMP